MEWWHLLDILALIQLKFRVFVYTKTLSSNGIFYKGIKCWINDLIDLQFCPAIFISSNPDLFCRMFWRAVWRCAVCLLSQDRFWRDWVLVHCSRPALCHVFVIRVPRFQKILLSALHFPRRVPDRFHLPPLHLRSPSTLRRMNRWCPRFLSLILCIYIHWLGRHLFFLKRQ